MFFILPFNPYPISTQFVLCVFAQIVSLLCTAVKTTTTKRSCFTHLWCGMHLKSSLHCCVRGKDVSRRAGCWYGVPYECICSYCSFESYGKGHLPNIWIGKNWSLRTENLMLQSQRKRSLYLLHLNDGLLSDKAFFCESDLFSWPPRNKEISQVRDVIQSSGTATRFKVKVWPRLALYLHIQAFLSVWIRGSCELKTSRCVPFSIRQICIDKTTLSWRIKTAYIFDFSSVAQRRGKISLRNMLFDSITE